LWLLLGLAYLATRCINLTRLPLFVDEGVYLWWAENILKGDFLRGMGEGRPLEGWLIALPLSLHLGPALASRLVHVLSGMMGLMTTCCVANRLLDRRVALLAGVLYVSLPYLLFFERLATPDALLATLGILSVLLAVEMLRGDWRLAVVTGITLVLAVLAKSPVGLYFTIVPVLVLIFVPAARARRQAACLAVSYLLPLFFLIGASAVVFYRWRLGLQPVGFGLHLLLRQTAAGVSLAENLGHNGRLLLSWLNVYLTWPLAGLLAISWLGGLLGREPGLRLLAVIAGLWLAIFVAASEFWVPRYILPAVPPAIIILAWGIVRALNGFATWLRTRIPLSVSHSLYGAALLGLLLLVVPLDLAIVFYPEDASLPEVDRSQYVEGYGAGYGFPEASVFLEQELLRAGTSAQVVLVHVSDYARLKAYVTPSLHPRLRQVHIVDRQNRDTDGQILMLLSWLSQADVTYVLVGSSKQWSPAWQQAFPQATVVRSFPKPGGREAVEIRRILTTP